MYFALGFHPPQEKNLDPAMHRRFRRFCHVYVPVLKLQARNRGKPAKFPNCRAYGRIGDQRVNCYGHVQSQWACNRYFRRTPSMESASCAVACA